MTELITTQFDISEVFEVYKQEKNYEIYEFNKTSNNCILYFSSNAIYFPNSREVFCKRIVQDNRFEWKKNTLKSARKVIFIRDVLKSWYLKGINSDINSIEKVLNLLEKETQGLKIICVGSSAGGYAATLFGSLLRASHVFNFSGQFLLYYLLENSNRKSNPLLAEHEHRSEINKYYSLIETVRQNRVPVFYFYPEKCVIDNEQAEKVKLLENVYKFAFNSKEHGKTCYPINFLDLFSMPIIDLMNLSDKNKGRIINPLMFSLHVSGWQETLNYVFRRKFWL